VLFRSGSPAAYCRAICAAPHALLLVAWSMAFLKFPDGPTVLKEYVCPDYEPTEKEIQDYAVWLGMDPEEDRDLFWIARAGVKSPMPEPWKPCLWEDSEMFFFNFETGQSVWDHPCDEYYRRMYLEKKAERVARLVASGSMSADQKDQKDKKAKKKKKGKKKKTDDDEKKEEVDSIDRIEGWITDEC